MRSRVSTSGTMFLALALALPAAARAEAPAGDGIALHAGDTVQFDLSGFPARYEGAGKVACEGTVIKATGLEPATCERSYRFEVPSDGSRMTYVFRATVGGRERAIDLPLTRQARPIDFTAPADGLLAPPAPVTIPAEVAERAARAAARAQCAQCTGGEFTLASYEITSPPVPVDGSPSIRLGIKATGKRPAK